MELSIEKDNSLVSESKEKGFLESIFEKYSDKLKDLKEYESIPIEIENLKFTNIFENFNEYLQNVPLLTVDIKSDSCYLKADGMVGVCYLADNENYQIAVHPKITVNQLAKMIYWAYFPELIEKALTPYSTAIHLIIPELFILSVDNLIKSLGGALRKAYIYHQEELRAKIKGRPNLTLYFTQNKPRFRDTYMPCSWWDLNKDNDYNRALKLGLYLCKKIFNNFSELNEEIKNQLDKILNLYFSPIILDKNIRHKINRLKCVGNFAPYKESIEYLKLLFDCVDFSLEGDKIKIKGIVIEMWKVFEQCVLNYIQKKMNFKIEKQKSVKYKIKKPEEITKNLSQNIIPDAIINVDNGKKFVLDTKWKSAFIGASPEEEIIEYENIKIKNNDIYQVIAYGMHKEIQAEGAFLIYPSEKPHNSPPPIWKITSFQGSKEFPIYILGVPLGGDLEEGLKYLSEKISNKIKETI